MIRLWKASAARRARTGVLAALWVLSALPAPSPTWAASAASAPSASSAGSGSANMRHVTTLAYQKRYGNTLPFGTDIELARVAGRDYAFAGTYRNGLQIIDVTDPRRPAVAAVYDCAIAQGDVQVFRQGRRTLATYTADDLPTDTFPASGCYRDTGIATKRYGTFIVDVSDPRQPRTAGFVPLEKGSHNQTVHPSGRYLYNSNSDLLPGGAIEVIDIADPSSPRVLTHLPLTGQESHDITFNAAGTRAYSAALSQTLILDTTAPQRPRIIGRIVDPTVNLHHQADPITIDDPLLGRRTFLIVSDELAGAAGNGFCPGGGLHVYDITGERERTPVKVGVWAIPEARAALDNLRCTAHVFRLYPEQALMTIAWYDAGVRVVDVSGLAGVSAGVGGAAVGTGMREVGSYTLPDADTWSAKTNRFGPDGSFYLFGNDINRGLDVYRFDAAQPAAAQQGTWRSPAEALAQAKSHGLPPAGAVKSPICLLPPR